jgi:hypothetical protein
MERVGTTKLLWWIQVIQLLNQTQILIGSANLNTQEELHVVYLLLERKHEVCIRRDGVLKKLDPA